MGYNTHLIGNYIHYRYDNYRKLGLRKSDVSGSVIKNNANILPSYRSVIQAKMLCFYNKT